MEENYIMTVNSIALASKGTCHQGLCGWREGASVWSQLSVTSSVFIEIKAEGGQQEAGEVYLVAIE